MFTCSAILLAIWTLLLLLPAALFKTWTAACVWLQALPTISPLLSKGGWICQLLIEHLISFLACHLHVPPRPSRSSSLAHSIFLSPPLPTAGASCLPLEMLVLATATETMGLVRRCITTTLDFPEDLKMARDVIPTFVLYLIVQPHSWNELPCSDICNVKNIMNELAISPRGKRRRISHVLTLEKDYIFMTELWAWRGLNYLYSIPSDKVSNH